MNLILVCGVNDSGKSTLIDAISEKTSSGLITDNLPVRINSSVLKRRIMECDTGGVLSRFQNAQWGALGKEETRLLNLAFFSKLKTDFAQSTVTLVVEGHLTYRHQVECSQSHGYSYVRVIPPEAFKMIDGIILMTTEPRLALSRRKSVVNSTTEERVWEDQAMELGEASFMESGVGIPVLRLSQRSSEPRELGVEHVALPSIGELAQTASAFIHHVVNGRMANGRSFASRLVKNVDRGSPTHA